MNSYAAAGNIDRVYAEEGVIDAGEYDPDLAGVYLLGKDIRRMASADTLDIVRHIIERDFGRLSHQMAKTMRHLEDAEDHVDKRLRLLQQPLA